MENKTEKNNDYSLPVSELVQLIKNHLEDAFELVSVRGEISNWSCSSSGHCYFTLSDKFSSLSAVIFKGDIPRNPSVQLIKNGDEVKIVGPINVYPKRGTFQLIAKTLTLSGKGDLLLEFEMLKKRLAEEGLFDLQSKKKIPLYPKKVAIITALGGAALTDFLNVYCRRAISSNLLVIPTLVQGEQAPASIIKSLKLAIEAERMIDVIVLTRGGGSSEDLSCFNNENLARLISSSPIPVVSAVGHQIDFTISDFVADLRAETPTAAAEILTEYQTKIKEALRNKMIRLCRQMQVMILTFQRRVDLVSPWNFLKILENRLSSFGKSLEHAGHSLERNRGIKITDMQLLLDDYLKRLVASFKEKHLLANHKNEGFFSLLHSLDPRKILQRGYVILQDEEKKSIISSLKDFSRLEKKSSLVVEFHDGLGEVIKKE